MKRRPGERTGRHSRVLSPEEAELWIRIQKTAIPLPGRKINMPELQPPEGDRENGLDLPAGTQADRAAAAIFPGKRQADGARTARGVARLDDRTLRHLRRGRLAVDATLDLHGMTQDHAHSALGRFVVSNRDRGSRILLVITGKGEGGGGILRRMVPEWLRQPPLSGLVSAIREAHPSHGGQGALYVRLRRQR